VPPLYFVVLLNFSQHFYDFSNTYMKHVSGRGKSHLVPHQCMLIMYICYEENIITYINPIKCRRAYIPRSPERSTSNVANCCTNPGQKTCFLESSLFSLTFKSYR
jgi:hypothetical protein